MNAGPKEHIKANEDAFGLGLEDEQIARLEAFAAIIAEHNDLLHLVGPCSTEEFTVRHILESLYLLTFLPAEAHIADVGTGAGLPSLPCLLVREGLRATLIESKEKKCNYLAEAVERLGLGSRVEVVNRQFEEAEPGKASVITTRALDKLTRKLPKLLKWAAGRELVLFGGPALGEALKKSGTRYTEHLIPLSEQRFVFVIPPRVGKRKS
ncbi:MAG TPA: class I SAM-dependent methyltransferase [Pyrinomonadaceae bacterium]|nr:class I SAM-dependent methyltransferase [Pyrinomonadaceae bacterium]